jgi:hypothetical protein
MDYADWLFEKLCEELKSLGCEVLLDELRYAKEDAKDELSDYLTLDVVDIRRPSHFAEVISVSEGKPVEIAWSLNPIEPGEHTTDGYVFKKLPHFDVNTPQLVFAKIGGIRRIVCYIPDEEKLEGKKGNGTVWRMP